MEKDGSEHSIWIEKYRPKSFSEIKGQKEIVRKIKAFIEQKNMPHLLFSGPAGTGKTTLSLVIARQLFGDSWRNNFLELNASDERGIDVIRHKVKDFARTRAIGDVPFKIIYLDECLGYNSSIIVKSAESVKIVKIGEFVEDYVDDDFSVLSVDDNGDKSFVKIINVMKILHRQEEGFYKIKIHDKEIEITGNHQLITPSGWKQVKDLQIGDLVLCPLIEQKTNILPSQEIIDYELVGLPQEIKKKEHYITTSPEKAVVELLACHDKGLYRGEITKLSKISTSKLSGILNEKDNNFYISLLHSNLIKKENNVFKLSEDKNKILSRLYKLKREKNKRNYNYITERLNAKYLYPIRKDKALIAARILGHLFSDGCLSLKTKQLFFSGKEEDLKEIKRDINELGYYSLGNVRHNRWRNGECWSFGAYNIELLSLFYSLGAPVGKKTDNYHLIPDWIMNGDKEIKKEFLASFFGGEGSKPMFQGRTIKPILIAQAKRVDLKENLIKYLNQIKELLSCFDIDTNLKVSDRIKNIRKDGTKTIEGKIWVKNSRRNTIRFLEEIGYSYCRYKEDIAKRALEYLKWKESLGKKIYTFRPIPYFEEWNKKIVMGESAYFYITDIEKLHDPEYVYCLATSNGKFIANDIIVHNCDALTKEAQQALRRTMENYTQTTRFILSCNYSSKIIDPIQSRCTLFKFKPLAKQDMLTIIEKIAHDEKLKIDEKAEDALFEASNGDCRRAENILQSCAAMGDKIDEDIVFSMASVAKPKEINEILTLAVKNKFIEARNKLLDVMLNYGLSGQDIIKQIQTEIWNLDIDARLKVQLVDKCGEIEFRMTEGADEYLQLEALLANFTLASNK